MQIELIKKSTDLWALIFDDCISDDMGFDEMLGLVIAIAAPKEPRCLEWLKPIKRINEPSEPSIDDEWNGDVLKNSFMTNRTFKALMLYGEFIDVTRLAEGIYFCKKPYLYLENETIENIIQETRYVIKATGMTAFTENYFDNLKQCILVDVEIIIK